MKNNNLRPHIGIFGRRNNGKSSLINMLIGQDIAIVDATAGTTTDPVRKSIEIFGIGPCVIIDTAGVDDEGEIGKKRVQKSINILKTIDLAILVITFGNIDSAEKQLIRQFSKLDIPYIIVNNKSDLKKSEIKIFDNHKIINISTLNDFGKDELIDEIVKVMPSSAYINKSVLGDIIESNDEVVLVTPIDSEAPEGRLILPQVQMIRDMLDNEAVAIVLQENQLNSYLKNHRNPKLVITDSQAFRNVSAIVPFDVPLTSFSILLAHHKGNFEQYIKGTPSLEKLKDGDKILMLESCTHLTSCEDIGRVKLPKLIRNFSKKEIEFDFVSGLNEIPDIQQYAMVIQCGGCMVTRKQLNERLRPAIENNIPISNYGMSIAFINGIFERATEIFSKNQQR